MERCSTPTRRVSLSDSASFRKRTSSPSAFTPTAKKSKAELSRGNLDKDKKRKRRKKKQPITRDVEMLSKEECPSTHSPQSSSSSTQMDSVGSSNPASDHSPPIPPPDHSPHVTSPSPLYHDTDRPEHRDTLRQQSVMQVVHPENKVCLSPPICLKWFTNYV